MSDWDDGPDWGTRFGPPILTNPTLEGIVWGAEPRLTKLKVTLERDMREKSQVFDEEIARENPPPSWFLRVERRNR